MEIGLNCSMSEWLSIVALPDSDIRKNTENRILGHIEQGSNLNANLFQCFHDPLVELVEQQFTHHHRFFLLLLLNVSRLCMYVCMYNFAIKVNI